MEFINTLQLNTLYEIGIVIGTLLAGISIGVFKKNMIGIFNRKKASKEFADSLKKNILVHEKIAICRSIANSDRVTLSKFHNGGRYLDGSPMKKLSVTHESCSTGVSILGDSINNVFITSLNNLTELLLQQSTDIISVKDMPDNSLKNWLMSRSTDYFCLYPLKKQNFVVGFFLCEWIHSNKSKMNPSDFKKLIKTTANNIEMDLYLQ